jgi:hypothetical protein
MARGPQGERLENGLNMNILQQYAVLREPNHVLVGIEPEGFNIIQLAEKYGSGNYTIALFHDGKLFHSYNQVVDDRLGPPKKTEPIALPADFQPIEMKGKSISEQIIEDRGSMFRAIEEILGAMFEDATDEHGRETALRAFTYASNRIKEGSATTEAEAKHAMAAFADGFCTGFHRGSGTPCTK